MLLLNAVEFATVVKHWIIGQTHTETSAEPPLGDVASGRTLYFSAKPPCPQSPPRADSSVLRRSLMGAS